MPYDLKDLDNMPPGWRPEWRQRKDKAKGSGRVFDPNFPRRTVADTKPNDAGIRRPAKASADVKIRARGMSHDALFHLGAIMANDKYPAMARVQAANAILDRAWGRPAQHFTHEVVSDLTDKELADELEATLVAIRQIAQGGPLVPTYEVVAPENDDDAKPG